MSTFETLKRIILGQLQYNPDPEITEASRLSEDLGADSLDAVEIMMGVEEEFHIQISDDDAFSVKTVGEYVALIERARKP